MSGSAISFAAGLIVAGFQVGPLIPTIALAAVAYATERQSVRLSPNLEISVSFLPFILAAVLLGPLSGMIVGATSLLSQFERPYLRWVVWTASRVIVCGVAGIAAHAAGAETASGFAIVLLVVAAASCAEVLTDLMLGALTVAIRGSGSLRGQVRMTAPVLLAAVPLYTPVAAVLVYAYHEISPWSVALFVVPAFAAHRLFLLYSRQRDTAEELERAVDHLKQASLSFASALVATLDARDQYTAGHSANVATYARVIAGRMGLSAREQELAYLSGLVHDIGKIGLPPSLLEKAGPLNLSERRVMEAHSTIGERILSNLKDYDEISLVVRHHHERVDGHGYPDGLAGSEIPLLARIIAVADAYDAMTSHRPYREAMSSAVARFRLAQAVEAQFDTAVVAAFEAALREPSNEILDSRTSARIAPELRVAASPH